MKRKKEIEIMLTALAEHGIHETLELKIAVEQGLKTIRQQKFYEKRWAKAQRKKAEQKEGGTT